MTKYKEYVGVTETGNPGLVLPMSQLKPLRKANIIITKHLENDLFKDCLIQNSNKIIRHHTITGWGGSKMEPGVTDFSTQLNHAKKLFEDGFPMDHYVLRCDPFIPLNEGYERVSKLFDKVDKMFHPTGLRVRISILDYYYHVRRKLPELSPLYDGFNPSDKTIDAVNYFLHKCEELWKWIHFEACAEHKLEVEQLGCVSQKDIDILGVDVKLEGSSHQRKSCLCPDNKIQLLGGYNKLPKCPSGCKYCYLK